MYTVYCVSMCSSICNTVKEVITMKLEAIIATGWVLDYLARSGSRRCKDKMSEVRSVFAPVSKRRSRKLREAARVLFSEK